MRAFDGPRDRPESDLAAGGEEAELPDDLRAAFDAEYQAALEDAKPL